MKIIVVLQQKGGVGKTTVALNIALYVAQTGAKVAIADADAQGSIRANAEMLEGVEVVDASPLITDDAESKGFSSDTDLVVVDTSPRNDADLFGLLESADFVLIPVKPGFLDVIAMRDTVAILNSYREKSGRIVPAGIVLNMVQHRNALNADTAAMLENFDIPVLPVKLYQRVAYARTMLTNGVMNSQDDKAKAEVEELTTEIFNRL